MPQFGLIQGAGPRVPRHPNPIIDRILEQIGGGGAFGIPPLVRPTVETPPFMGDPGGPPVARRLIDRVRDELGSPDGAPSPSMFPRPPYSQGGSEVTNQPYSPAIVPPPPYSRGGSEVIPPHSNAQTETQPQPQSVQGQPLRSQQLQQEYSQFVNPPEPGWKRGLAKAALNIAPIALGGLFGGTEGAAGAAQGVEQVNAEQAALREKRREELQKAIEAQLGRESTMDIEAARERGAMARQQALPRNIDPNSPEGIAARIAIEQGKPQLPRNIDPLSPEGIQAAVERARLEGETKPPPQPSDVGNYLFYAKQERDRGRTPLSFDEYQSREANRRQPRTTISPYAESNIVERNQRRWDTQSKVATELQRQVSVMDTGLNAARRGDLAGGSQAVLVTFQKILDPTSVVRESEYARSGEGQSLVNRISGAIDRLQKGGAGVPLAELEKYGQLAHEMAENSTKHLGQVKKQIEDTGKRYGIPPELLTTGDLLTAPVAPGGGGRRVVKFGDLPR
jgi:hypothetical protein